MTKRYIHTFILIIVMIFAQVIIFNHLRLFSYCVPIIYIYPILKMPIRSDQSIVLLLGMSLGLLMDIFMNTLGLNMAVAVFVSYMRLPILKTIMNDDIPEGIEAAPSFQTFGSTKFLLYVCMMVILHISSLLLVEAFSVLLFYQILPYILGSSAVTIPIILIIEAFRGKKKKS